MGKTYYTAWPAKGQELNACFVYHIADPFPPFVRVVLLYFGDTLTGFVEGDGAVALRERKADFLKVLEVSDISGCGEAVEVQYQ